MAKKGLGKGLEALFTGIDTTSSGETVVQLKISEVEPDRSQPRHDFDEVKLAELAGSIKEHGVITPIIVKKLETGFYQIVAGERRWRASKLAEMKTIPAIIRDMDKEQFYEVSMIENLQRQDLNPVEEAKGYKRLTEEFGLTQEQISKKLGKSRSSIANSLRMLNLPREVISLLESGRLSFGHAKVLLSCEDEKKQIFLANKIADEGMSVRELENAIKSNDKPEKTEKKIKAQDLNFKLALKSLEDKVTKGLSTKVKIVGNKSKGKIEIEYYGTEDLERIVKLMNL